MGKSSRVPGRGMPRFICSHLTAGYARTKERIVLHGTPNRHGAAEGGGDCWIWFKVKPGTYGRIMVNGKKVKAHRYSYEKKYGPIPSGLHACHTCDNPRCVNPDHIFPGTDTDNVRDCVRKGRLRPHGCAVRTSCRKGHPYKEGSFIIDRQGYRNCLVCRSAALTKGRA